MQSYHASHAAALPAPCPQDNPMRLGLCSRSKDVIEPVLKPQWWVDCKDAAARSCAAVRDGSLQIIPAEFEAVWFRWAHWRLGILQ